MARATTILDRYATETGIPLATVGRHGRALREAKPPLWIFGGSGPGTGEHANNTQIVNLMISCGVADPILAAARLVTAYREARYMSPIEELFDDVEARPLPHFLKYSLLGLNLDYIVDELASLNRSKLWNELNFGNFSVTMVVGDALVAWVEYNDVKYDYDAKPLSSEVLPTPPAPLFRTVKLTLKHFDIMAELWADTLAQKMPTTGSLLVDLPSSSTKNETAAACPLPGTNAAALSDQPAETDLDDSRHSHPMVEREKTQPSSESRAGRPHQFDRSDKHDRHQCDFRGFAAA